VLGTASVGEVVGQDECLAARAVEALVVALVEIARLSAGPSQPLDAGTMARVGARADEVID
jgi:hypothetical protein